MSDASLYRTDENCVIAFSGGRTSAYMLRRVLDAYDGSLPENIKVCFANTGKEMPETLDFVRDCGEKWDIDIVWLEAYAEEAPKDHKTKVIFNVKTVTYDTAARNGEPFLALMKARDLAPNPVARFCTKDLKSIPIRDYLLSIGWEIPYVGFVGIRADEERRASKLHGTTCTGQERYLPLWLDGITKQDVSSYWSNNTFDLNLPNNNGVTDWGNCDLCFLKAASKKLAIIRERPDLADWWIYAESQMNKQKGAGAFFRADHPSYADMKIIATSQQTFDFGIDESIPCFCGD